MSKAVAYFTATGITADQEDVADVNRPTLMGYSINEAAGSPAAWEVKFYDGATVSGGISVEIVSGTAVFYKSG